MNITEVQNARHFGRTIELHVYMLCDFELRIKSFLGR
jgi:hypothetical protein